jgi:hypothetical protein
MKANMTRATLIPMLSVLMLLYMPERADPKNNVKDYNLRYIRWRSKNPEMGFSYFVIYLFGPLKPWQENGLQR